MLEFTSTIRSTELLTTQMSFEQASAELDSAYMEILRESNNIHDFNEIVAELRKHSSSECLAFSKDLTGNNTSLESIKNKNNNIISSAWRRWWDGFCQLLKRILDGIKRFISWIREKSSGFWNKLSNRKIKTTATQEALRKTQEEIDRLEEEIKETERKTKKDIEDIHRRNKEMDEKAKNIINIMNRLDSGEITAEEADEYLGMEGKLVSAINETLESIDPNTIGKDKSATSAAMNLRKASQIIAKNVVTDMKQISNATGYNPSSKE